MNILFSQSLLTVFFLTIVYLHVSKKNFGAVVAYGIQSLVIVAILVGMFLIKGDVSLLVIALLTLIIKVIVAPMFFVRLVRKHKFLFSASSYLNMPLTLVGIAILTAVAHSEQFGPLTYIIPRYQPILVLALSSMLLSLFLLVNRKGALSQIIGILSLENGIIAFASFAGLEQSLGLQIGVIFDISVWLVIATVFVSMIYRHFGSLDVTSMKHLRD